MTSCRGLVVGDTDFAPIDMFLSRDTTVVNFFGHETFAHGAM